MKKIILLFTFLNIVLSGFSQTQFLPDKKEEQKRFFVDILTELHSSYGGDYKIAVPPFWYSSFSSMKKTLTTGYQAGGAIGYRINKNIGITLGALYSKQGQNYSTYSNTEQDSGTSNTQVLYSYYKQVELRYLKVPVQFYYTTNETKMYSFTCFVGFYCGYLLQYTDSLNLHGSNSSGSLAWSETATGNSYHYYFNAGFPWNYGKTNINYPLLSKPYRSFDFGQMLGIGVQKKLSSTVSVLLMANYQIGFMNVKNADSQYSVNNSPQKFWNFFGSLDPNQFASFHNFQFGISAGFRFII